MVIAGFFTTVSNSFSFPTSNSLGETAISLHVYTQSQAKLIENTNSPKQAVLGPPGTGKTWSLIRSTVKLYFDLKRKGKKGRILVMTYNVAVCKFIEDAIKKIITYESTEEKEQKDIDIKCFTADGLKKHLSQKMRGKITARRRYSSGSTALLGDTPTPTHREYTPTPTPTLGESIPPWEEPEDTEERHMSENETFHEIFHRYCDPYTGVSEKTLLDNFGYCGIFIDEVTYPKLIKFYIFSLLLFKCQNMDSGEEAWLMKLWKREKKRDDCSKFLMFGDCSQFVYSFKGDKENSLAAKTYKSAQYEPFKQVVRYGEM